MFSKLGMREKQGRGRSEEEEKSKVEVNQKSLKDEGISKMMKRVKGRKENKRNVQFG
jgi:hypothetical protein